MAFGIIRARNLQAGKLAETDRHNARRYDGKENFPSNIDPEKVSESHYLHPGSEYLGKDATNLEEAVLSRIKSEGVTGIRKNTNVAIEYVTTVNDRRAWEHYDPSAFFSNAMQWLEKRHGKGSVVAKFEHYDESNPHAHFIVVPIQEKEISWKNRRGEGTKLEKRLNVRDHTGGREKLRDLQNGFYEHLVKTYGGGEDSKLGVPIYRGKLVEHQTREYIQKTDAKIGVLRAKLATIEDLEVRKSLEAEIELRRAEKAVKEAKLEQLEQQKLEKGKNWASKGTKDNPEIFHSKEEKAQEKPDRGWGIGR